MTDRYGAAGALASAASSYVTVCGAAMIAVASDRSGTVIPAEAGISTGSCCVLLPGDPSLRWGDVRFERTFQEEWFKYLDDALRLQ